MFLLRSPDSVERQPAQWASFLSPIMENRLSQRRAQMSVQSAPGHKVVRGSASGIRG